MVEETKTLACEEETPKSNVQYPDVLMLSARYKIPSASTQHFSQRVEFSLSAAAEKLSLTSDLWGW